MFQDVSGEKEELMFRLYCDYMTTAFGPATARERDAGSGCKAAQGRVIWWESKRRGSGQSATLQLAINDAQSLHIVSLTHPISYASSSFQVARPKMILSELLRQEGCVKITGRSRVV